MNQFVIEVRDAMHIASGPANAPHIPHLHTVLTDPWEYQGSRKLILVNITKLKSLHDLRADQTCIITPDDCAHPFITLNSYVLYQKARVVDESSVIAQIEAGNIALEGTMSNHVFQRITDGLMRSRSTPAKVKNAFNHYLSV